MEIIRWLQFTTVTSGLTSQYASMIPDVYTIIIQITNASIFHIRQVNLLGNL